MTDHPLPAAIEDADSGTSRTWHPLAPQARWPILIGWLISALVIAVPTGIGLFVLLGSRDIALLPRVLAVVAWAALWLGWFWMQAHWNWKYCRWCLDAQGLRVRSGRFWHKETLIPRTRVQHLDLERGPLERKLGLSTLIVHTAGTRLQALRQSGFRAEDAQELRDALIPRERVGDDII